MMFLNPHAFLPGYAQLKISVGGQPVLENRAARNAASTASGPDHQRPSKEDSMTAHAANNAPDDSAQPAFIDPLIEQARLANWAAQFERNLAARKALRPARSAAAKRGWERRNG